MASSLIRKLPKPTMPNERYMPNVYAFCRTSLAHLHR
nr:MAG TPA: hypothetical protein [Caudoviricetes sp.]